MYRSASSHRSSVPTYIDLVGLSQRVSGLLAQRKPDPESQRTTVFARGLHVAAHGCMEASAGGISLYFFFLFFFASRSRCGDDVAMVDAGWWAADGVWIHTCSVHTDACMHR